MSSLPLFQHPSTVLPNNQRVLHIHVPAFSHMFNELMFRSRPWLFGHTFCKGSNGSASMDNAAQASRVGALMEISRVVRLKTGSLMVLATAVARFEVVKVVQEQPYARVQAQLLHDQEELLSWAYAYATASDGALLMSGQVLQASAYAANAAKEVWQEYEVATARQQSWPDCPREGETEEHTTYLLADLVHNGVLDTIVLPDGQVSGRWDLTDTCRQAQVAAMDAFHRALAVPAGSEANTSTGCAQAVPQPTTASSRDNRSDRTGSHNGASTEGQHGSRNSEGGVADHAGSKPDLLSEALPSSSSSSPCASTPMPSSTQHVQPAILPPPSCTGENAPQTSVPLAGLPNTTDADSPMCADPSHATHSQLPEPQYRYYHHFESRMLRLEAEVWYELDKVAGLTMRVKGQRLGLPFGLLQLRPLGPPSTLFGPTAATNNTPVGDSASSSQPNVQPTPPLGTLHSQEEAAVVGGVPTMPGAPHEQQHSLAQLVLQEEVQPYLYAACEGLEVFANPLYPAVRRASRLSYAAASVVLGGDDAEAMQRFLELGSVAARLECVLEALQQHSKKLAALAAVKSLGTKPRRNGLL